MLLGHLKSPMCRAIFSFWEKLVKCRLKGVLQRSLNRIYFTGGDNIMNSKYSSNTASSKSYKIDLSDTSDGKGGLKVQGSAGGYGGEVGFVGGKKEADKGVEGANRGDTDEISVLFTLQDEQGWLVFETISGLSSCPHEDGTVDRVDFTFTYDQNYGQADQTVYVDEFAQWRLTLRNNAETYRDVVIENQFPFVLYPYVNLEGAYLRVDGAPWIAGKEYYQYPKTTSNINLEAYKPPGDIFSFDLQIDVWQACWRSGDYELRYLSECTNYGVNEFFAYSEIWEIIIDWEPPVVVKFPEPQDGLLSLGDEISFQFNEPIQCDFTAQILDANDEIVLDSTTTLKTVCFGNGADGKILFDAMDYFARDENLGARFTAEIGGVEDIHGNQMDGTETWEFGVAQKRFDVTTWVYVPEGVTPPLVADYITVQLSGTYHEADTRNFDGLYIHSGSFHRARPMYYCAAKEMYLLFGEQYDTSGWILSNPAGNEFWPYVGGYQEIVDESTSPVDALIFWKVHDIDGGSRLFDYKNVTFTLTCADSTLLLEKTEDRARNFELAKKFYGSWELQMASMLGVHDSSLKLLAMKECDFECDAIIIEPPYIIASESGVLNLDVVRFVVRTSAIQRDITFKFQNATNEVVTFHFNSQTFPSKSHH